MDKALYGYGEQANGYSQLDRPLLSKHFQILRQLCSEAEKYTRRGVNNLYASTLLSASVFSRTSFTIRANQTVDKRLESKKTVFKYVYEQLGMASRGNLIANAFNTDWTIEYGNESNSYLLRGVPRLFANGSCNCVVSDNCQRPLRIGPTNLVLPGLVVGCSPLYGTSFSTLECLYSSACVEAVLNYLHYYTHIDGSEPSNFTISRDPPPRMTPLSASKLVHFSPTDTIGSLVDELLIDELSKSISYEKYFDVCAPSACYYSYLKSNSTLYIITSLLGLYGGLTISLRFLIWNTSRIYYRIRRCLRRQTTPIEPFIIGNAVL